MKKNSVRRALTSCLGILAMVLTTQSAAVAQSTTTTTTPSTPTTYYYAWDKGGNEYTSAQSQAAANSAAAAWNKSHKYSSEWSGFVTYGVTLYAAQDAAGVLKGNASNGDFWIVTSQSGAVFTSGVSLADAQSRAAADTNPAPSTVYTATSSSGITYTSTVSQTYANAMATFDETAAVRYYVDGGPNGQVFRSATSFNDAYQQEYAWQLQNPYYAYAGNYVGYLAATLNVDPGPADMVLFEAASQAAADAAAKAWGTRLVEGGVFIATPAIGNWVYVDTSQARANAAAGIIPYGQSPNFTYYEATSSYGVQFYSALDQQFANNAAAYTPSAPRPIPTTPEICYEGSQSNTISLISYQCPAGWTLLKAATVSKAAEAAFKASQARTLALTRTLYCDSATGTTFETGVGPKCPAGYHPVPDTAICVKGAVTIKITEVEAHCPSAFVLKSTSLT